jgi:hypothetical protein
MGINTLKALKEKFIKDDYDAPTSSAGAFSRLTFGIICKLGGKIPIFVVLVRSHSIDSVFSIFGNVGWAKLGKTALKPTLGLLIKTLTEKGEGPLMKAISEVWRDKGITPADLKMDINKLPDALPGIELPLSKIKQEAVELVDKYHPEAGVS